MKHIFVFEIMDDLNNKPVEVTVKDCKSIIDAFAKLKDNYGNVLLKSIGIKDIYHIDDIALDKAAPVAIGDLEAEAISDTEITIDHSPSNTATWYEYIIIAGDATLDATKSVRYTVNDLPITIAELTPETEYDVSVRACNSYGPSAFCAVVTETTEATEE